MSVAQLGSGGGTPKGRRPKGGVARRVVQAKLPTTLQQALFRVADESSVTVTDLGAYYLIRGWNQTRVEQGLGPIPMPAYLEAAVLQHQQAELQASLVDEESRLAG